MCKKKVFPKSCSFRQILSNLCDYAAYADDDKIERFRERSTERGSAISAICGAGIFVSFGFVDFMLAVWELEENTV